MATQQISWLKFAEQLKERYSYLLNSDLCLRIVQDAHDFVNAETGGAVKDGE
jgi:hypothetical protein